MSLHDLWWSLYDWERDLSWSQRVLRVLILVSSLLALTSVRLAGSAPSFPAAAVVLALTVLVIFRPQSHAAAVLILAVAWVWYRSVSDPTTPWVIAVALSLLVLHAAGAMAATAPAAAPFQPTTWVAWAKSVVIVAVATTAVWLFSLASRHLHTHVGVALVVVTLVVVSGLALVLRGQSLASESPEFTDPKSR